MHKYPSKFLDVHGTKIHYLEEGEGSPILFLHGIPTSSYIWRNIIPHLSSLGRCIAPDLIGFGKSEKPDIDYSIDDHIEYIASFIDALNLKNIVLVTHGFGSIIGCDYAMKHEKNCRGLVLYEAFLRSVVDENVSLPYLEQLVTIEEQDALFTPEASGAQFIDSMIPQAVMRELSESEMNCYREPFTGSGSNKPISQYIKELPRGDGKSKLDKIIANYTSKLQKSQIPKLMLYAVPGFITTIATAMWAKEHLPNLELIDIGEEIHLGQESCPDLIGESISIWLQGIEHNK